MKKLLLILFILSFTSCITQDKCRSKFPCVVKNDTTYKETFVKKDSFIYLPEDQTMMDLYIRCDSNFQAYIDSVTKLTGKRSNLNYKLISVAGKQIIKTDCKCDSLSIYLSWKERHIEKVINTTETIKVQQKWYEGLKWILILILSIICALIIYRFIPKKK